MATFPIPNAPKVGNMNDFRSLLAKNNDVAKVAKFAVRINGLGRLSLSSNSVSRDMAFLCEAAELPGRALTVDDYHYYGPMFKVPHQSTYTDLNLTFIVRNNFLEKQIFDAWMQKINPKSNYNFTYRDSYSTTIDVYSFDDELKASYVQTVRHAYPIFVNPMPLTWAEDNYHRLQVTFAYVDWITPKENVNSPAFELASGESSLIHQSDPNNPNVFIP